MNHEKHFYLEMIRELEEMGLEEIFGEVLSQYQVPAHFAPIDKTELKQAIIKKIQDKIDNLK